MKSNAIEFEITNFFYGGDEVRKEILAQPEAGCGCCLCSAACYLSCATHASDTEADNIAAAVPTAGPYAG